MYIFYTLIVSLCLIVVNKLSLLCPYFMVKIYFNNLLYYIHKQHKGHKEFILNFFM